MPILPTSQQADWGNNVFIQATTRILVMIGLAYLVKSLYAFWPLALSTRSGSFAAGGLPFPSCSDLFA